MKELLVIGVSYSEYFVLSFYLLLKTSWFLYCSLLPLQQRLNYPPLIPFDWVWLWISQFSIMRSWIHQKGLWFDFVTRFLIKIDSVFDGGEHIFLFPEPAILQSRLLMKLFQSSTPWMRSPTKIVHWSCNFSGTTWLSGLLTSQKMEVIVNRRLAKYFNSSIKIFYRSKGFRRIS